MRDLSVLRALESVPRSTFVFPQHTMWASRNIALPAACGQTVPEPLVLARMLAGSRLAPDMRVLVIGLGSGYGTAVLSRLVREVVAVDRFRTLVAEAEARFATLGVGNIDAVLADGLDLRLSGVFDRILIFATLDPLPARLWDKVKEGGAIIHGRIAPVGPEGGGRQVLMRVERRQYGIGKQTVIGPSRFLPLRAGLAARL